MADAESEYVSWRELLNPRDMAPLLLVCLGVWLHAADELLLATMMPAIVAEIGGEKLVSWNLALYEIGSIAAGAASGLMASRRGLRVPMAGAAILFALGCATSALAPAMEVILAGRLLQGIGGGGLVALSFVAIGILFPKRLMPRVMAAVSAFWGMSAFLGPLAGGMFVEYGSWRGGFWFFAAQAALLALWILLSIGKSAQQSGRPAQVFPAMRLAILSAGVVLIAYGGIDVSFTATPLAVLAGVGLLVLFLRIDANRGDNRLLPRRAISFSDPVGAGLTMVLFLGIATVALSIYGPLFLTAIHGISVLVAGFVVACSSIGWTFAAIAVSGSPERRDPMMISAGVLMLFVSIPGFVWSVSNGPVWLVAMFAAMEGGGFGLAWTFVLRRFTALAPPGETERISAALPTLQRLGYAIGAAYCGIIANAAGFAGAAGPDATGRVSEILFLACIPAAIVAVAAATRFVTVGLPVRVKSQ